MEERKKRTIAETLDDMQLCINVLRDEPCAAVACSWMCDLMHDLTVLVKEALLDQLDPYTRKLYRVYSGLDGVDWSDLYKGPKTIDEIREAGQRSES